MWPHGPVPKACGDLYGALLAEDPLELALGVLPGHDAAGVKSASASDVALKEDALGLARSLPGHSLDALERLAGMGNGRPATS
jgi:hypothetical protein